MRILEDMAIRRQCATVDWIHDTLWSHAESIHDNNQYILTFDKLEILMALSYAYHKNEWSSEWYWAPPGDRVPV